MRNKFIGFSLTYPFLQEQHIRTYMEWINVKNEWQIASWWEKELRVEAYSGWIHHINGAIRSISFPRSILFFTTNLYEHDKMHIVREQCCMEQSEKNGHHAQTYGTRKKSAHSMLALKETCFPRYRYIVRNLLPTTLIF